MTPLILKSPRQSLPRKLIDFFNNPTYNWAVLILKKLRGGHIVPGHRLKPSFRRFFTFKLRWEHVVIAFLLGALMMNHGSGRILRLSEPAPAQITIKPLPLLKDVSYEPVASLERIWENKLRPYGTYSSDYAPGNCTIYVASRLPLPNSMGNASNWAYAASQAGLTVSSVPKPGVVAQTTGDSYLGHVAVVESVNPDGSFVISEMNYLGYGLIDTRTTTTAEFYNFIYP